MRLFPKESFISRLNAVWCRALVFSHVSLFENARWFLLWFKYLKNPVELFTIFLVILDAVRKKCCYWFLLFVCLLRFGFHRTVAIYVECELCALDEQLDSKYPTPSIGENDDVQSVDNQQNKDEEKEQ